MNYLTLLALTLSDWVLTKLCLYAGCIEGNPVVGWIGGIDNGLILKIVCWALVVVFVPITNNEYPKLGDKILKAALLLYAGVVLWNACIITWPIL